jgi:hypothetical protein
MNKNQVFLSWYGCSLQLTYTITLTIIIAFLFAGKHRSADYRDIISEMLDAFEQMKVHDVTKNPLS